MAQKKKKQDQEKLMWIILGVGFAAAFILLTI